MGLLRRLRERRRIDNHDLDNEARRTLLLAEAKAPGAKVLAEQINGQGVPWITIIMALAQALLQGQDILAMLREMLDDLMTPSSP